MSPTLLLLLWTMAFSCATVCLRVHHKMGSFQIRFDNASIGLGFHETALPPIPICHLRQTDSFTLKAFRYCKGVTR